MAKKSRFVLTTAVASAVAAVTFVSGCSTNSSADPSASASAATNTATGSPSSSSTSGVACNVASIRTAIPKEVKVLKFQCTTVDGTAWAVVSTNPGPEVYFLKDENGSWSGNKASEICGTASAGLPPEILNYCPS